MHYTEHMNQALRSKIWPGIRGIRKLLENVQPGWHVWIKGEYHEHFPNMTITEIINIITDEHPTVKLAAIDGNTLSFTSSDPIPGRVARMRSAYHKVEVTQLNWNGQGKDRTFTHHVLPEDLEDKKERIRRGYNLGGGKVRVTIDGKDVTKEI